MSKQTISGPAWNNSSEYSGIESPEFIADVSTVDKGVESLLTLGKDVAPFVSVAETIADEDAKRVVPLLQEAVMVYEKTSTVFDNLTTYVHCVLSVDGKNEAGKLMLGKLDQIGARLATSINPIWLFLRLTHEDVVTAFLEDERTAATKFMIAYSRRLKDQALSLDQEDLLIGMRVNGPTAWGKLYDNISSSINFSVQTPDGVREVGLAEASSLAQNENPDVRKSAYQGTNEAWVQQEEGCASVLNALSGWRHDEYRRRSHTKSVHFLDAPLYESRIEKATLDAMMGAVEEFRPQSQRVLQLMAKALGKEKLDPWDLGAPCPRLGTDSAPSGLSFDAAMDLIVDCFGKIDGDMADFARMMQKNEWIEGTVSSKKRQGAYCTNFAKSRSPRVYMTYTGTMREVKTLAHEIGHAFHSWVMRDMPYFELDYPMTLAETASIFAETVVTDSLMSAAKTADEKLSCAWSGAREVDSLLINVASRFDFERDFYDQRQQREFSPKDIKAMMASAWKNWYGDTLTEMNDMFWASKLHFHISEISFYNYPYIFGYLFSLGVYSQREKLGDKFYDSYVSLLRDTGRMTAEEVASKHLGVDLTRPDFWQDSLKIAKGNVDNFESVVAEAF